MVLCLLHHHRPNIHIGIGKALYFIYGEIQGLEHMVLNGAYGEGGMSATEQRWFNVGPRLLRWPSINPTLGGDLVSAG